MRFTRAGIRYVLLLGILAGLVGGCGEAKYCDTSLISLDETRLDAETFEAEAAETDGQVADLEARLAEVNGKIDKIKEKPDELEEKVRELKKGSGRE